MIFFNLLSGSSEIKSFPDTKTIPSGSLVIYTPVNNAACVSFKPTFSWYTLQEPSRLYILLVVKREHSSDSIATTDTSYILTYDLLPNTTYRWYLSRLQIVQELRLQTQEHL